MNWGTKLVIGMVLFMSFIITLAVLMIRSDSDDLVDVNYYEKGIEYDKDYERKSQLIKDKAEPEIGVNDHLKIIFKGPAEGNIRFIHPSDKTKDSTINFNSGTDSQVEFPLINFRKGHWKISLEWKSNGKSYLYDKNIIIN
jgi:hypothetical protein